MIAVQELSGVCSYAEDVRKAQATALDRHLHQPESKLDPCCVQGDPAVERENVCVVGNPMGDLPHAADEARSVKRCYNGAYSSPILGVSAVKDRVISAMGRSSVVGIQSHPHLQLSLLSILPS